MIPPILHNLINRLRVLPGVGQKTAQRYALHLIERDRHRSEALHTALGDVLQSIENCYDCGILKEHNQHCILCSHPERDPQILLIVPSFFDVIHFEELSCYKGLYHVLGGHLSPLDNIGPHDLRLAHLSDRIQKNAIREVILALSPTLEGEATAYYIAQLLKNHDIVLSRLATGIPVGGDLERVDAHTLALSIKQRSAYTMTDTST